MAVYSFLNALDTLTGWIRRRLSWDVVGQANCVFIHLLSIAMISAKALLVIHLEVVDARWPSVEVQL